MKSKREKGRTWDGKSRVVNDLYRKNFEEIFGKKTEEDIERERTKNILKKLKINYDKKK